ncbi:MAG: hypothetical protein EXX96DRAFT_58307 [Benjaminiella poitrasii]|nr:MAG: hypothetical protein EXX96DRAFT_58307 [Benjaminiella poitrasii]
MKKWSDLPSEILLLLFDNLYASKETLCQCQLVCKNWNRLAQAKLYDTVELRCKKRFELFLRTILNSPSQPGRCTRIFCMFFCTTSMSPSASITSARLVYIIRDYMPNLEQLTLKEDDSIAFWRHVAADPRYAKQFSNLKRIPVPRSTDFLDLQIPTSEEVPIYTPAVLALRDSVNHAILCKYSLTYSSQSYTDEYHLMCRHLKEFRQLDWLEIAVPTTKGNLFELEQVLQCELPNTISTISLQTTLSSAFYNKIDHGLVAHIPDLISIQPLSNVDTLDVNTFVNDSRVLEYIMRKFPNLRHLDLNIDCGSNGGYYLQEHLPFTLPTEMIPPFVHYLHNLTYFSVTVLLKNFIDVAIAFLLAAKEDEKIALKLAFMSDDDFDELDRSMNEISRITRHDILSPSPSDDLYLAAQNFDQFELESSLPFIFRMIEQVGHVLNTFDLNFNLFEYSEELVGLLDNTELQYLCGHFLDHIFQKCTRLSNLAISGAKIVSCNATKMKTNLSITTLTFSNCELASNQHDVFYQLSERLPALSNLRIRLKSFWKWKDNDVKKRPYIFAFNMPFTSFKLLAISHQVFDTFSCICIKLTINEISHYYVGSKDLKFRSRSEREFNELLQIENSGSAADIYLNIRCKSLQSLQLKCSMNSRRFFSEEGTCEFID